MLTKIIETTECADCVIRPNSDDLNEENLARCVRCPFCKQTVTAILTPTHIACPECKVAVKR